LHRKANPSIECLFCFLFLSLSRSQQWQSAVQFLTAKVIMSKKCGCTCLLHWSFLTFWWKSWMQQMMEMFLQCSWKKWMLFVPCNAHRRKEVDVVCSMQLPIEEKKWMLFVPCIPRTYHNWLLKWCHLFHAMPHWKKWCCLFHASQGLTIIDSWSDVDCSMQCPMERSDVVCSMHPKDLQ